MGCGKLMLSSGTIVCALRFLTPHEFQKRHDNSIKFLYVNKTVPDAFTNNYCRRVNTLYDVNLPTDGGLARCWTSRKESPKPRSEGEPCLLVGGVTVKGFATAPVGSVLIVIAVRRLTPRGGVSTSVRTRTDHASHATTKRGRFRAPPPLFCHLIKCFLRSLSLSFCLRSRTDSGQTSRYSSSCIISRPISIESGR